jgi:hypothetical protein
MELLCAASSVGSDMERLGQILFVSLDGAPPKNERLDQLPDASHIKKVIAESLGRLLPADRGVEEVANITGAPIVPEGVILVYAFGHAWLGPHGPQCAIEKEGKNILLTGGEIFRATIPADALERTMLVLDCCHSAAFNEHLPDDLKARLIVYACGKSEKAISLTGERASRLSLALADHFHKS